MNSASLEIKEPDNDNASESFSLHTKTNLMPVR